MAETYLAATRIKTGAKEDEEYVEVGDKVTKSQFDDWDDLVAARAVVTKDEYEVLFPERVEGVNQAWGTPSNLAEVEGSELQVNLPEEGEGAPEPPPAHNPADPPQVDGAVNPGEEREADSK